MTEFYEVLEVVGVLLGCVLMLAVLAMYVKNLIKIVKAFKIEDYGFITILRVAGVFIFPLGFVMGFV